MLTEAELINICGGFWGFDIVVSIITTVGCAIVGRNRKEPVKEISESFVVVEKDKKGFEIISL